MTEIERQFGDAMLAIYREAKDIGYTPSIFFRMLNEKGAYRRLGNLSMPRSLQTATRDCGTSSGWI